MSRSRPKTYDEEPRRSNDGFQQGETTKRSRSTTVRRNDAVESRQGKPNSVVGFGTTSIIRINDLKVRALIGAYSWEKANKQELIINITLEYDASLPCRTDKLKDALNYETVAAQAIKTAGRSRHTLLEKLTSKLLAGIMSDQRVKRAQVRVDKPQALPQARCVSFELSAER